MRHGVWRRRYDVHDVVVRDAREQQTMMSATPVERRGVRGAARDFFLSLITDFTIAIILHYLIIIIDHYAIATPIAYAATLLSMPH